MRQDAGQVGSVYPTFPLCSVPGPTVCKVLVAVRLKLLPTKTTHLNVCRKRKTKCERTIKPRGKNISYDIHFILTSCVDAELKMWYVCGYIITNDKSLHIFKAIKQNPHTEISNLGHARSFG